MAAATHVGRKIRADAQRNREHILAIAQEVFFEEGVSGSMDTIAKRAGVGAGTLYRNFPNRETLLAELLQGRDEELSDRQHAIESEQGDPTRALSEWLDALGKWACAFGGLSEPLKEALWEKRSPLAITCQGFVTVTEDFLHAAQENGGARDGVSGRDLFLMVLATAWVSEAAMADGASPLTLRALMRSGWATSIGS